MSYTVFIQKLLFKIIACICTLFGYNINKWFSFKKVFKTKPPRVLMTDHSTVNCDSYLSYTTLKIQIETMSTSFKKW